MSKTPEIQKLIRKIAKNKNYTILEDRRILLSENPKIFYQPDFLLLKGSRKIVIEIELTTDARKELVGDIVRTGLIGAERFVGIIDNEGSKKAIENYGKFLTGTLNEIKTMKISSIVFRSRKAFESDLDSVI